MTTQPELTSSERKKLRGRAMRLKPALIVGKAGPTPTVVEAVSFALERDELIKIRIEAPDRPLRERWLEEIASASGATVCGTVGHTASLFRPRTEAGPASVTQVPTPS